MNKWNRFSGILGLVCLAFGLFSLLVFRAASDMYTVVHLLLGVLLIVYWLIAVGFKNAGEATQIVKGRSVRFGVNATIYTVVFVAILVALNWIVNRHNKRIDLTEEGVYSLAGQSAQVIEKLSKPLKIAAFDVGGDAQGGPVKDLLALYKDRNPGKVTTEFINPRTKPQLVEKYGMKGGNIIYLEYGEGEGSAVSRLNETTEEAITNAIVKLTQGEAKKIYYLTGHGEARLEDGGKEGLKAFSDSVKDEHLTMETLVLSSKGSVPQDASAIVLDSPKTPLLPGERDIITKYIEEGGRVLLLADPEHGEDVTSIAGHFGIDIGKNVVIDMVQRLLAGPTFATQFLANNFGTHPATRNLSNQDPMVFDMASSVKSTDKPDSGVTYSDIVKTSEQGWAETNLKALFNESDPTAQLDPEDLKGPVAIAVAYEKKLAAQGQSSEIDQKTARLVVFGDSDWITNQYFRYASHRDVVLNTINWLAGQESNITIRPRTMKSMLKPLPSDTFRSLLMSGFLVPELIVMLGLLNWWRRRVSAI